MTSQHVLNYKGFSGGRATARSIVGCFLALNLAGALPAVANSPGLPPAELEQTAAGDSGSLLAASEGNEGKEEKPRALPAEETKSPPSVKAAEGKHQTSADAKAKPGVESQSKVTDHSKVKGAEAAKAKAAGESKPRVTEESKAKAASDKKSKDSDEGKAKAASDKKSKDSDKGKAASDKKAKDSDEGKTASDKKSKDSDKGKAASDKKSKDSDEGKAASDKKSKDSDEGKAKASSDKKSKDSDEGKAASEKKSKESAEVTAKNADGESSKPKKGFFRRGKDKTKDKEEADGKVEEKGSGETEKADVSQETNKPAPVDGTVPAPPVKPVSDTQKTTAVGDQEEAIAPLLPDPGLISILKDISRGLTDSEEAAKIEDPCQKAALSVSAAALAKALANPDLAFNRIISAGDKERFKSSMTVESWASGDIQVSPQCHASLSAVWAKKVEGLVNVAVAGNCNCKSAPDGNKVGEFVLVLNARSTVDTGFDIQSQTDVNFWLGKLTGLGVDTSCCATDQAQGTAADGPSVAGLKLRSQPALLVLQSVMTERSRKHQAAQEALNERRRQLAIQAEEERIRKEEEAKAQLEAEAKAKAEAEALAKAEADAKAEAESKAKAEAESKAKVKDEEKSEKVAKSAEPNKEKESSSAAASAETASETSSAMPAPGQARASRPGTVVEDPRTGQTKTVVVPERPLYVSSPGSADQSNSADLAMTTSAGEYPYGARPPVQGGWDSPAPPPAANLPSAAAQLVVPGRAIAGQFLTSAVLNPRHAGESSIELSFNGATLATGPDGKALYMVPEDALPGPTLHVSLVGRPESAPIPIHILQPLATPQGQQIPRIDRVSVLVPGGGAITIDGHHFDGVANRNSVIIDGMWDARVLVSSPVELKADLPPNLSSGVHAVSVNTGGLRSNPGQFEVVIPEVQPLTRETAKESVRKLVVRASGTKVPVRLRVRNLTPEILKISKGNDLAVMTPGGLNNSVLIDVQRIRPGAFRVEATME